MTLNPKNNADAGAGRVRHHRSDNYPHGLQFVYVCLPSSEEGASAARQIEPATISALVAAGIQLRSKHDARAQPRRIRASA